MSISSCSLIDHAIKLTFLVVSTDLPGHLIGHVNDLMLPLIGHARKTPFYWSVQIYLATSLVMSMTSCSLTGHASKLPFYWSVQIYLAWLCQ
jgi:hypothetical protein